MYLFHDSDESYVAYDLDGLTFYPTEGMTAEQIQLQITGSRWIGQRTPIDLSTARIGDDAVPPTYDRRAAIMEVASRSLGTTPTNITVLEGLFLAAEHRYLALVKTDVASDNYVVGTGIEPHLVGCPETAAWRRLSIGVGEMLQSGELQA